MTLSARFGVVHRLSILLGCIWALLALAAPTAGHAQTTSATLTGIVVDPEKAIIPGASVTVVNETTKFKRSTTANSAGVFNFTALDSGDYDLTISNKGFAGLHITKIHLNPGDTRSLENLVLKVGEVNEVVNVNAEYLNNAEDTGARSSLITAEDLQKLSLQGRDVTELLKILPGAAIGPGGYNGSNSGNGPGNAPYDSSNVQIGGAAGSYSMSGSPTNGVSITSDGANLTDPGSYSGGLQTVNSENTQEVKVSQSNFGADTANGPLVINAVGKVGGQQYHGEIYAYGRAYQANATDSFAKEIFQAADPNYQTDFGALGQPKPQDRFIYPGGQIGGPVRIPGTDFNHNKKLTFFVSGEDYAQRNTYAYGNVGNAFQTALVPTAAMRMGDFSPAQLAKYLPPGTTICPAGAVCGTYPVGPGSPQGLPAGSPFSSQVTANIAEVPISSFTGQPITCTGQPGDCLTPYLDPGAKAIFKTMPLPNLAGGNTIATPGGGGFNYLHVNLVPNNFWQTYAKVEYAASEKEKLNVVYSAQMGNTIVPQAIGYFASASSGGLTTPGGGSLQNTHTQSGSMNLTSILSPSLTNEAYLGVTYNDHYNSPYNGSQLFDSAIGFPYTGAYNNGDKQFPTSQDYGFNGLPLNIFPDYSFGPLYTKTLVPTGGDNLTKTIRTHTIKVGVDIERPQINDFQSNGAYPTQGSFAGNYYTTPTFYLPGAPTGGYHSSCYSTTNNVYCYPANQLANFAMGVFDSYSQANELAHLKLYNWTNSFYGQDDWKARKNLNITVGLRLEHLGRWTDTHGIGAAVFSPALYATDGLGSAQDPLPGFRWHAIDSSVPLGGFPTRALFYAPRAGFSWQPYHSDKTVVSGGWGQFRFHEGEGDAEQYLQFPAGVRNYSVQNPNNQAGLLFSYVDSLNLSPDPTKQSSTFSNLSTGSYTTNTGAIGLDPTDTQSPLTTNYSLTVTQAMQSDLVFSIAYVGNKSQYLLNDGSNEGTPVNDNINALPVGALFTPDPNPQSNYYGLTYTASGLGGFGTGDGNAVENDWRPYRLYGELQVTSHKLYANYNSLQVTLDRTKGIATFHVNYTFSKTLGVRGSFFNGVAGDSFNPHNNYGPLSYDRSQILNISYFLNFSTVYHGNRVIRGIVNGFQVSGYTGVQSGPNVQANNYATNFGISGTSPQVGNQTAYPINSVTYLGTPDVQLQPTILCSPTSNLAKKQYMNGACFGLPAQGGANGVFNFPYIHGPAYYDSDVTLIRGINLSEGKSLELRAAAFNALNQKLNTFTGKAAGETQLEFPYGSNPFFGDTAYTVGRRVMEFAVKLKF
jgi:hypothetical protein